ncbi:MAG: EAL domain-containing protein [Pseudomonadota bacterium]
MILNLLNSSALALVLCWLITWNSKFWTDQSYIARVLAGIALGAVTIVGMLNPVQLTTGVIYDVRLIIINAAALFGGPITGTFAALITISYRLWIGGVGAPTGALSIVMALIAGLIFRGAIEKKVVRANATAFFSMGVITHAALLIVIQFTLDTHQFQTSGFLIAELVLLPIATLLLCLLMQNQQKRIIVQQDAKRTLNRLQAISEAIPDLLLVLDENGKYLEVFSGDEALLVIPKDRLIGSTLHDILPKERADFFLAWVRSVINDRDTKTIEYEMDTPHGRLQFEARASSLGINEFGIRSVVLLTRDVTNRKELENQVHSLAYYDSLTNLPNRRHLMERLECLDKLNLNSQKNGALLHIDLDDFKFINEVHGHSVGNQILQELVFRLQELIHAKHYLARIGGDAFAILIEELHPKKAEARSLVENFAQLILKKIEEPFEIDGNQISLSGSIGIVMLDNDCPLHDLMVWAELALYAAKDEGKNTSRFFDPILQESLSQRMKLEREIRVALITNQLRLFYQPQVNSRSQIIGVEALIRWNHPERGLIPPFEFLPVAEQAGLMPDIDRWVFQRACKDLELLILGSNNPQLILSVNIGGALLSQADLFNQLSKIVNDAGVDPHRIQIEVTETTLVKNLDKSKAEMLKLKNQGFKFSLDDFGTGYSSFNYLRQFPIDEVKIDQSFVHGLPDDRESLAIIQSVIALSSTFGFTVIAEGIESIEQEESLIVHGCAHFQGYFYSKPLPLESLFH